MQQFIVVTHQGPCVVPKEVFTQIVDMKKSDRKFGDQILFALQVNGADKIDIRVRLGSMPKVGAFGVFHQKFIMEDPPQRRNIII